MTKKFSKVEFLWFLFATMLFGCTIAPISSKPIVSIGSPGHSAQVNVG